MNEISLQGHVVTENKILFHHEITIQDGIIQSIVPSTNSSIQSDEPYIFPGFREQHVHDWVGQSLSNRRDENRLIDRFRLAASEFAGHGVTEFYAATFGAPFDELEQYCRSAQCWMDDPGNGVDGAKLLGVHIEGTFLNVECRGAQPAEYCLIPGRDHCIEALNRFKETGAVKLINIVPDYGAESLNLIRRAAEMGFLVGAGHTKTTADLLQEAFDKSGLKFLVHFTNGPTGQSFKPFDGGGAFEGGMNCPIHKEMILDRTHVDERYVLDILRRTEERWGADKIITVTDSLFPAPEEIPSGEFAIGSTLAKIDSTGQFLRAAAYLQPDGSRIPAPPNTLCSSILTMDHAFINWINLFTQSIKGFWFDHLAQSLDEAIVKTARLCSTHQAMLDGSYSRTGSIDVGKDADLVVGSMSNREGVYDLRIRQVYVKGKRVIPRK